MMMEYEWGNPAATAAAMMLFADNSSADTGQDATVFDHYSGHGLGNIGGIGCFFPHSQPMAAAVPLFSPASSTSSSSCHQRFGLPFPPQDPARIGLNLGVRTYFSSRSPDDELPMVPRVFRRRTRIARCQADGCGADLTNAKHYHRRHKVCEFHSKSSIVITAGLSQRFCQQCSRFHVLSEFDQGKRSCRKRLADHNRRRRKSQDLSTASINSQANTTTTGSNDADKTNTNSTTSITATKSGVKQGNVLFSSNTSDDNSNNNNNNNIESSVNLVSSPVVQAPPQMGLGLGCGMSPASFSLLPQLADFRVGAEQRFSSWVDEEEEEEEDYNIGGIYQNK